MGADPTTTAEQRGEERLRTRRSLNLRPLRGSFSPAGSLEHFCEEGLSPKLPSSSSSGPLRLSAPHVCQAPLAPLRRRSEAGEPAASTRSSRGSPCDVVGRLSRSEPWALFFPDLGSSSFSFFSPLRFCFLYSPVKFQVKLTHRLLYRQRGWRPFRVNPQLTLHSLPGSILPLSSIQEQTKDSCQVTGSEIRRPRLGLY